MGLLIFSPVAAQTPVTEDPIIQPIYTIYGPSRPTIDTPTVQPRGTNRLEAPKLTPKTEAGVYSGRHSTRAEKQISENALRDYLLSKRTPLAPYASLLLQSPHYSTIIGICTIEQYGCTRLPGGKNWNLWGIGGASGLRYYSTAEEGIQAISELLAKYEAKGKDTIEKLNGYYVQPASTNWFNTVLKIKTQVENL